MGLMETVGSAMLRRPTVHGPDLTVGEAQEIFAEHPKTHLLLLAEDDVLLSAVVRSDVEGRTDLAALAREIGTVEGRTVTPDQPLEPLRATMADTGPRRLAVVDAEGRLLGLLCLKRSRTGFCTDEGVAAMRAERRRTSVTRH